MTVTTHPGLIDLTDASDETEAGGKAGALARARADGYLVPDGLVVPVSVTTQIDGGGKLLGELLPGTLERLGGVVAVRSSGVSEDGVAASFAGQFETTLGVSTEEALIDAVRSTVASAGSAAADAYRREREQRKDGIAVLIQRMLAPTAAGVAFSVDPVTGIEHVAIEATSGVGDALLAGEESGERWTVSDMATSHGPTSALDARQAESVADLCRSLHERAGAPVDIEWAIEDGQLYLLQVRPITAVPLEPTERPPDGQAFVREPRFDGPLRPLSFSTWLPRHGAVLGEVFGRFGLPIDGIDNRLLYGRVYSRMVPFMDRGKDGPTLPSIVMKLLLRFMPAMRRRMARALAFDGDDAIVSILDRWDQQGRAMTSRRTRELRSLDLEGLDDEALAQHLDDVLDHVVAVATDHFELMFAGLMIPTGRLGMLADELLDWPVHDVITLVQGYGAASLDHSRAIADLIESLGPDKVRAAIADPESLRTEPAVARYVEQHGHRVNVDLSMATEAEDPALIADHLRRHSRAAGVAIDPRDGAHEMERRALEQIPRAHDRRRFGSALALARRGRPYGDETEATTHDALAVVRYVALDATRRLVASGRLARDGDIWFLEQAELSAMLRSPSVPTPDLDRRRREYAWALANPAPDVLGPEPVPLPPLDVVPPQYRSTVGAVLWATATEDAVPSGVGSTDGVLGGLPGSPGKATGPVRIVRDIADFGRVEPGDIVVCPITIASWSPIFGVIAGLVTERGGFLSHPATLAREFGLPAVLAVPGATAQLTDGARVEIDGGKGTVTLI